MAEQQIPSDEELFGGEEGATAPSNIVEQLVILAKEASELEETIESLNEALKVHAGRLNHLKQKQMPEMLAQANLPEFTWLDQQSNLPGVKMKLSDYVGGSLPKEEMEREEALAKIVDAGGGKLITCGVIVDFPKSQREKALEVFKKLHEELKEIADCEFKEGIHASTLASFVREKLKKGEPFDYESCGIHVGKIAKITLLGKDGKRLRKGPQTTEE